MLAYAGERERRPTAVRAHPVSMAELRGVRDTASAEFLPQRSRDAVPQLGVFFELLAAAAETTLMAAEHDGELAAFCVLYRGDGVAQIDEVSTLERARRHGLGTAVVEGALRAALSAGDELVFLMADERDWPRRWYERIGFRPIARRLEFTRAP